MDDLDRAIKQSALLLGYPSLKPEQLEIVTEFVKRKDVFVVLPTGYRKTLCFGMLPLLYDLQRGTHSSAIVVVVTPLVAIMQSMVAEYKSRGIRTGYISNYYY